MRAHSGFPNLIQNRKGHNSPKKRENNQFASRRNTNSGIYSNWHLLGLMTWNIDITFWFNRTLKLTGKETYYHEG